MQILIQTIVKSTLFFERMNNWLQIRDWGTNFVITLLTDV